MYYINYDSVKNINTSKINYYFILEKDFFIAYEVQKIILYKYQKQQHYQTIKIIIQTDRSWEKVHFIYQQTDFFEEKKILLITINMLKNHHNIIKHLSQIVKYNNVNIILFIRLKSSNYKNNMLSLKKIIQSRNYVFIYCPYLTIKQTEKWIKEKIQIMNFNLELDIIKLLSYYYEKNLLMLFKILETLQIISFDTKITQSYIRIFLIDNISFSIKHLLYALFLNNKMQAIRIIKFFKKEKYNISYVIRSIQNNLLYLIHLKENYIYKHDLNFSQKDIIFYDKAIPTKDIITNINYKKMYNIINILIKLEINNKIQKNKLSWKYMIKLIFAF